VVDFVKTDAGDREVYLSVEARRIIKMIMDHNLDKNEKDDDYLFVSNGKRVYERAVDYRLRKYCKLANISQKSMHKIRKTYISTLIDARVNINELRKQVGHEDEKTTYRNYCFNRLTDLQTEEQFENALVPTNSKIIPLVDKTQYGIS